ncbi:calcium-dependent protein kinase 32-like isoform X2 [Trifolium pratense]|uniref:calcium-dependent protein kinase 32-like isoform X2 n=1 Tax=Trifolium pratense TaxID=57577 RepID=UPI001E694D24|nr:calcium-dependent protein kinase 32-like isoform X2 [Trifolium pratense]
MENLCGLFKNKKRKDWPEKINNNINTNKLVVLKDPTGREIGIRYKLGTEIWRSESGITYHCNDRQTGEQFSYKWIYKKNKLRTAFDIENLRREVEIMRHLPDHPNIVSLKDTYEDDHHVHLVMELCQGGNLLDRIIGRGYYTERSAASVVKSIVEVVQMCHEHGVMYRNLKLENCLFANKMDRGPLKVTDFRLSIFFKPGERLNQIVGNLYYMAPEVLKRNYGSEIDIWSAGVILYILLCGFPPFWAETEQGVSQAIIRSKIDFNREPWPKVSDNAKDLVKKMLDPDPKRRFTAQEVLDHPWLQNAKTVSKVSLGETVRAKLLQFSIMNQLTKTTSMVILKHLTTIEKVIEREISWVRDTGVKFSKIDDHEVRVRLHKLAQQIPHVDEQRLMNACDENGYLDYGEFLAISDHLRKMSHEEHVDIAFQYFDKMQSGYIELEELHKAIAKTDKSDTESQKVITAIMHDVATNKDGRISYEEITNRSLKLMKEWSSELIYEDRHDF